jgi:alkylation response protein AidB-like acyl-CoA dehydrogenase
MELSWTPEELVFRDEVRTFFAENLTDEIREAGRWMTSVYSDHGLSLKWQEILLRKGWAAPAWPVEYGGCDWSVAQHYLFNRERARAGAPPLSPMGIQMCAPALIAFGTPQQKEYFLPRTLSGEVFWCQGYSEPESGSDLASLKMPARREGDHFICNGTKIWNTHADIANWAFCLVRTSTLDKPQKGITFLLIEMNAPGVEVRPIVSLTGEHIQNEIFFTDVRVPVSNVVGKIDDGWTVAKYLLEFERGGNAYSPELQVYLEQLRAYAATVPGDIAPTLLEDPTFAASLADTAIRVAALEMFELRTMSALASGGSPGTAASVMKIIGTELRQRVTELGLAAAAKLGRGYRPEAGRPGGPVSYPHAEVADLSARDALLAPLRYFNERAASIYAGSNEIQRNILVKAALGL